MAVEWLSDVATMTGARYYDEGPRDHTAMTKRGPEIHMGYYERPAYRSAYYYDGDSYGGMLRTAVAIAMAAMARAIAATAIAAVMAIAVTGMARVYGYRGPYGGG